MLRVDEYRRLDLSPELQSAWAVLHAQTPEATFFQSLEWLQTYWRHYGGEQRLRLLVVSDGDRVVGIVPLTVFREASPLGRMRVLTYPQAYWGSYYGPIGPRPRETLRTALEYLRRTRRDWDLLDLRFTPADEQDPAATVAEMTAAGFLPQARQTGSIGLVDLPATNDEYLASRTKKWRTNCRRWRRRLESCGRIEYVRYRPSGTDFGESDPRWNLYDACEQVARRSWQGSAADGTTISHESIRPFLRDLHATACRAGAADVNLLTLDDRPIAFFYAYHYRGRVFGLRTGFDPETPVDGVGNVLYMRMIEDSIARGDRLLDLGPGSLDAKKYLLTRIEPVFRQTYGNPRSWRGLLWRAKRLGDSTFSRDAQRSAEHSKGPTLAKGVALNVHEVAEAAASEF